MSATINSGEALRQAALAGGGIILQPDVLVADDLRRGRLKRVSPSYEPPSQPMHVVYRTSALAHLGTRFVCHT